MLIDNIRGDSQFLTIALERQIILGATFIIIGSKWFGSWCRSRSADLWHWRYRRLCRSSRYTFYFPRTDRVEPTILPLTSINVKRDVQFLTHLYIKLLYLIIAKHIKTHFSRVLTILVMILYNIRLYLQRSVRTFRNALPWLQYCNNFSLKIHYSLYLFAANIRYFSEMVSILNSFSSLFHCRYQSFFVFL